MSLATCSHCGGRWLKMCSAIGVEMHWLPINRTQAETLLSSNPGNRREKMPYAAGRESEQAIGIADIDDWKT